MAARLPGLVQEPAPGAHDLLGLRRQGPHRRAGREQGGHRQDHNRLREAVRHALPDQADEAYKGSDYASIDVDNTSAFNCRPATGSTNWSNHAYGQAVDVNPRENPYVTAGGGTAHQNAKKFTKRPMKGKGVINPGDKVVKAFASVGWGWGGSWSGTKDLQHFSSNGR
jgi:hypothetical protein